jgi:predicted transcriptional regulator
MKKYLFISVKEEYTNRIFDGTKKIELRKAKPNVTPGDHIIIYCTSPIKAIVGVATVKEIIAYSPQRMWKIHSKDLGISKSAYLKYYGNSERAIGIVLSEVEKLNYTICLSLIKEQLPSFTPPQTYKYFINFISKSERSFRLIPG